MHMVRLGEDRPLDVVVGEFEAELAVDLGFVGRVSCSQDRDQSS
jgi:hypothetical protein